MKLSGSKIDLMALKGQRSKEEELMGEEKRKNMDHRGSVDIEYLFLNYDTSDKRRVKDRRVG